MKVVATKIVWQKLKNMKTEIKPQTINELEQQWAQILTEFENQVTLEPGKIFVVGCSTSEIIGQGIGKAGSVQIAEVLLEGLMKFQDKNQIWVAIQCCEHLNRALVIPRQLAMREKLEVVSAIPVRHAGGALGATCFALNEDMVLVENIQADYGIDLGLTLIGDRKSVV